MNPKLARALDEDFAIDSPFDATSAPFTVRWLDSTPDGILINEAAQNHFSFDLASIVTNNKGVNAGKFEQPFQGNIKPEAMSIVRARGITYHNTMVLSPGQYTVKMVVRDNLSGKGSLSASLIVN